MYVLTRSGISSRSGAARRGAARRGSAARRSAARRAFAKIIYHINKLKKKRIYIWREFKKAIAKKEFRKSYMHP